MRSLRSFGSSCDHAKGFYHHAAGGKSTDYSCNDQTVTPTATVAGSTVNEGTVTFTVKDSEGHTAGMPVSGDVIRREPLFACHSASAKLSLFPFHTAWPQT